MQSNKPDLSLFSRYSSKFIKEFLKFHYDHPEVYKEFTTVAKETRKYQNQYSAGAILEIVRWHRTIKETGEPIKVRNAYRAMYARLLVQEHPDHFKNFFRFMK
jgi:hypothetical protein